MDQAKLQAALAETKDPVQLKPKLGEQFKEGDVLKVTEGAHGTSATWRRPSDGQRVTANVQPERPKTPVKADKKLAGAPENK